MIFFAEFSIVLVALIKERNSSVNHAKSLLGILSLGYIQQETLEAVIDGPDEQAAAQALQDYFSN